MCGNFASGKKQGNSRRTFNQHEAFPLWRIMPPHHTFGKVRVFQSDYAGNEWYGIVMEIQAQTVKWGGRVTTTHPLWSRLLMRLLHGRAKHRLRCQCLRHLNNFFCGLCICCVSGYLPFVRAIPAGSIALSQGEKDGLCARIAGNWRSQNLGVDTSAPKKHIGHGILGLCCT